MSQPAQFPMWQFICSCRARMMAHIQTATFLVAILLVATIVVLTYQRASTSNHISVDNSLYTLAELERIRSAIVDAENSQLSLLVTDDKLCLASYEKSFNEIDRRFERLLEYTALDAQQHERAKKLQGKLKEKLNLVQSCVKTYADCKVAALQLAKSGANRKNMQEISQLISEMDQVEQDLMQRVHHNLQSGSESTFSTVGALAVLASILMLAIVYMSWRYVGERNRVEEELLIRDRAIAASTCGVWIIDFRRASKPVVYVNSAFSTLTGYSSQDILGQAPNFLKPGEGETPDWAQLRQSIKNGTACEVVLNLERKDGASTWNEFRVTPVVDQGAAITHCVCIQTDVSARKEAETQVSEFYSMVSHELRTPLTSIRGSLSIINGGLAGDVPAKCKQLVGVGLSESERLIRLINDILDVRKLEVGKLDLVLESVLASDLVETAITSLSSYAEEAEISLAASIQQDAAVICDRDRIMQVLTNLISNAVKFSPPQSSTIVEVTAAAERVRFAVIDSGDGIPTNKLNRLFSKFVQLDSSPTRKKGGTGLGLAISKSIVEQHGGSIGVESEIGKGSTFWFELPTEQSNA